MTRNIQFSVLIHDSTADEDVQRRLLKGLRARGDLVKFTARRAAADINFLLNVTLGSDYKASLIDVITAPTIPPHIVNGHNTIFAAVTIRDSLRSYKFRMFIRGDEAPSHEDAVRNLVWEVDRLMEECAWESTKENGVEVKGWEWRKNEDMAGQQE